MFDGRQVVGDPVLQRNGRRPGSRLGILPRMPGQEGGLAGTLAVAGDVEQVEILQGVGPDDALGRLHDAVLGRLQLGADLGGDDCIEHGADLRLEIGEPGRPADQVLDQGLRHAGVDVVVAHVVADAIGRPAQRQLGKVAGADHQTAALPGGAEQIVGAQARLHVLERQVVDRLAAGIGMVEIGQHPHGGRLDVDLLGGDLQGAHQVPGIALGGRAGGEAGQGEAEDARARLAH